MSHNAWPVSSRNRVLLLVLVSALALAGSLVVPRLAQEQWYHQFADDRTFLGIKNTWNVVSNLPFLAIGLWGLAFMASSRGRQIGTWYVHPAERWPYFVFFLGLALTGVGSAYYHWTPNNDTLLWDRLPLAVAFMALFAAVIGERINLRAGIWLLGPLVLAGAGSVIYWQWSETQGHGDLRPYFFVQFFPLIALPLIFLLFPAKYTRTQDLIAALGLYVLAKALEALDTQIYSAGAIVSGHTLKHLVAGGSCYMVLHMIRWRRPITN